MADDRTGRVALVQRSNGTVGLTGTADQAGVDHVAFGCGARGDLLCRQQFMPERGASRLTVTDAPHGSGLVVHDPDGTELELFPRP